MTRGDSWLVVVAVGLATACGGDPAQPNDNNTNGNIDAICGDGIQDPGEECDDGTLNSDTEPDACRGDCRWAYCGDGVVDPGEAELCDDGGVASGDGCDNACQVELGWDCSTGTCVEVCGDDLAVGGEVCDGSDLGGQTCISIGQAAGALACTASCTWDTSGCVGGYVCGDGTQDPGEECDDGNLTDCDGCSADCLIEGCGNFVQECGEACDDGNTTSGDGCSADCQSVETCGNGYVDTAVGEACDDAGESAGCNADCTLAACGDGILNVTAGEACDDGNTVGGDLCAADCSAATCPTGNSCVEAAPGAWQGPVAIHADSVYAALPACPAEYPAHQIDLNASLQSPGTCDCDCGAATGFTCNNVLLFEYNNATCSGGMGLFTTLVPNLCVPVTLNPARPWFAFSSPGLSGGFCTPSVVDGLQSPYWTEQTRVCGGATVLATGCGAGEVCAPDPTAGYDPQRCIYATGDIGCPSGSTYSERFVLYSGIQDNRTCGSCACDPPVGTCNGNVVFKDTCSGLPYVYGSAAAGQCENEDTAAAALQYVPSPTVSCEPSPGTIQGTAAGTGPYTFCCQP